jgi:FkbM family methyltransferase
LWNGTVLRHPPERHGLLDGILEVWIDEVYGRAGTHLCSGDLIVDAGANVGLWSIYIARRHPSCDVLALEPFPENFRYLQANISASALQNISAHRVALGGDFGTGRMTSAGNRSLDHRLTGDNQPDAPLPSTGIIPIQELFRLGSRDRIGLLKVDIEGSEYDLFESADLSCIRRVDQIAIEYHDHIRPGTLQLLKRKLSDTHTLNVYPSPVPGCGMLFATRRMAADPVLSKTEFC